MRFLAEQGEILAADGSVTKGHAVIDESSITGEAKPINANVKDTVKSGSRIISGVIRVKAVKVGKDSILGRMISVMVLSCPCALGIDIPLALVAGVSAAGKKGILVRDFEAFERVETVSDCLKTRRLSELITCA